METRANYVLIGIFALAGFLGVLAFFLLFAKFQFDRQYAYYEVRFASVSGLSRAADVRFAGLSVGRVLDLGLAEDGTVAVRLEVDRETPIRADSVAVVDSSGITGVAFVSISTGTPEAPLVNNRDEDVRLQTDQSTIQSLTEAAPRILDEALLVIKQVNRLLGEQNQQRVENILANIESSSGDLSEALDSFSGFSETMAAATQTFSDFSGNIRPLIERAESTLETLEAAIVTTESMVAEAQGTLQSGTAALDTAENFIAEELTDLVVDLSRAASGIRTEIELFSVDARSMFDELGRTGAAATARIEALDPALARIEPLLARAETALVNVESMALTIDTLVAGDGTALVAETREMVALARDTAVALARAAETDLPVIVADIRAATADVRAVVAQVGQDLSSASGQLDALSTAGLETLSQVTETFAGANVTLDAINRALETGEGALQAAERVFVGADRVINEEVAAITADLRGVLARLGNAVDAVADDIPAVTADLRSAAVNAASAFDELGSIMRASGPQVRDFTTTGLPAITQLARETRGLIGNLDRLTRQLENDPARFILNRQSPEFRR